MSLCCIYDQLMFLCDFYSVARILTRLIGVMPALTKAQRGAQTRLQHGTPLFQKRPYDSNQENINPQSTPVSAVRNGIPKGSRELAELHDTASNFPV